MMCMQAAKLRETIDHLHQLLEQERNNVCQRDNQITQLQGDLKSMTADRDDANQQWQASKRECQHYQVCAR